MSIRSLLPVLAIAGGVAAQCSTSATLTIQNSGDAAGLAGCRTYTGSIALATGTTDAISIPGVQEITGSLIANNVSGLPSLEASSLQTIGKSFTLQYLTVLTSLTFPRLSKVDTINWVTVPRLNALSFTTGVKEASNVQILDTGLGSLSGIAIEVVNQMIISSNGQLQSINMPLETVNQALRIEFNSQSMNVSFPNLEVAYNATFTNVSSISIPSLSYVNGSLGFYGNFFQSLAAPNLTTIGGTLSLVSNTDITNASFPALTRLGGALQVANNTKFDKVTGFPQVNTVLGAVDISGNFSDFTLPALGNGGNGVQGAFNLQSLQDISAVCSKFQPLQGRNSAIKGKVTCTTTKTPTSVDGTVSGGGNSSNGAKKGAAPRGRYTRSFSVTGVLGLFTAMLGML